MILELNTELNDISISKKKKKKKTMSKEFSLVAVKIWAHLNQNWSSY